ncbi:STAS domain-containing protein [Mameliella sediminis]|uniref:STAS domain-containing protein n=1 Tax=Mameliella sediminis TaxID=2836866 RepID=UPI001C4815C1|nr:STAS domain-containing protein [Mameliella sediminis]MBV7396158.1 STAS domain-containing protein [Mameliella sediminis]MBY6160569.1 STAS domain-containing protein [Mameliella alba]MBY6169039.1 STAS domain-containing protein [Mameliella alba]MBY6173740.1 STAS domain-containing protein [Mameliella alba]
MQLTTHHQAGVDIITVDANRIDAAVAIQFKDRMREVLGNEKPRYVLDLHQVEFIDSSGLGAIVAAMKLMPKDGKLELAGLSPAVDKVFRMTRMDSIFAIHPSVEAAASA